MADTPVQVIDLDAEKRLHTGAAKSRAQAQRGHAKSEDEKQHPGRNAYEKIVEPKNERSATGVKQRKFSDTEMMNAASLRVAAVIGQLPKEWMRKMATANMGRIVSDAATTFQTYNDQNPGNEISPSMLSSGGDQVNTVVSQEVSEELPKDRDRMKWEAMMAAAVVAAAGKKGGDRWEILGKMLAGAFAHSLDATANDGANASADNGTVVSGSTPRSDTTSAADPGANFYDGPEASPASYAASPYENGNSNASDRARANYYRNFDDNQSNNPGDSMVRDYQSQQQNNYFADVPTADTAGRAGSASVNEQQYRKQFDYSAVTKQTPLEKLKSKTAPNATAAKEPPMTPVDMQKVKAINNGTAKIENGATADQNKSVIDPKKLSSAVANGTAGQAPLTPSSNAPQMSQRAPGYNALKILDDMKAKEEADKKPDAPAAEVKADAKLDSDKPEEKKEPEAPKSRGYEALRARAQGAAITKAASLRKKEDALRTASNKPDEKPADASDDTKPKAAALKADAKSDAKPDTAPAAKADAKPDAQHDNPLATHYVKPNKHTPFHRAAVPSV